MIKAIIFDMDGVLVESEKYYLSLFKKAMDHYKIPYTKDILNSFYGSSQSYRNDVFIEQTHGNVNVDEVNAYIWNCTGGSIAYENMATEGVVDLIKTLDSRGYKLAIASSNSIELIEEVVKRIQIDCYIDKYFSGCDCLKGKPDPEVYFKTMEALGVKPEECIVVEDSVYGIQAAKDSGAYVLARRVVEYPVDQHKADVVFDDMVEVLPIIERRQNND